MKTTLLIFNSLFLTSCLGGGSDYYRDRVEPFLKELRPHYKPQVFDGVMEPEFPNLEEDKKTLVGIDSNNDGVRDDMEIFINRNFKYDYERKALKGDFRRAPAFFNNYQKMNNDDLIVYMSNHSEELRCLNYAYEKLKLPMSPEIKNYRFGEVLYNTRIRSDAYGFNSKKIAGRAYGDGFGERSIYQNCVKEFDEKYLSKK